MVSFGILSLEWVKPRNIERQLRDMHFTGSKNCNEGGKRNLYTDYKKIYCSGNKQISEDKDDYYDDQGRRAWQ